MNTSTKVSIDRDIAMNSVTLPGLARQALDLNDGNTELATDWLAEKVMKDPILLRIVINEAVRAASSTHIEEAMRHKRRSILRATTGSKGAVVALSTGWTAAILDMPLANGIRLRDATKAQVIDQAQRYAATAQDAGHKARWLSAIADAVPAGKRVGEVLSDEAAAKMYKAAE